MTVAEHNARESGIAAIDGGPDQPQQAYYQQVERQTFRQYNAPGHSRGPFGDAYISESNSHPNLNAAMQSPAHPASNQSTPSRSTRGLTHDAYVDDPKRIYSRPMDPQLGVVNPFEILDDGDDGLDYVRRGPRTSMLSLGGSSNRSAASAAVPAGAAAGGVMGGLVGGNGSGGLGPQYAPVNTSATAFGGKGASSGAFDMAQSNASGEKAHWKAGRSPGEASRKRRLLIIIAVGILIAIGIALGIVFGYVLKKNSPSGDGGSGGSGQSATQDTEKHGDLSITSQSIQALLNNKDLHKVFPGIDYTPLNTQYPECVHNPPSQNNVTRDVAVLSQLTNTIRLYGTDCNQTQMVLHSLRQLKMQDSIKLWLGVWQDNNATTNSRQLAQMWDILDEYGAGPFKGIIVANEILFREQMTVSQLGKLLADVRTKLAAKGISLPVATSDLGDKWTAALAEESDYVMANIHPFFSGTNIKEAAVWTHNFWTTQNGPIFKKDKSKNIISETGWPTQGGTNCGGDGTKTVCPNASVAGISQVNQFMEDCVCDALANKTNYFWFEAFDEPWKIKFNTKLQNWEDHWGLIDVNRNLKDGIKIPDCGGKTIDSEL